MIPSINLINSIEDEEADSEQLKIEKEDHKLYKAYPWIKIYYDFFIN